MKAIHVDVRPQQKSDGKAPPHGFKAEFPPHELVCLDTRPMACAACNALDKAMVDGTVEEIRQIAKSLKKVDLPIVRSEW